MEKKNSFGKKMCFSSTLLLPNVHQNMPFLTVQSVFWGHGAKWALVKKAILFFLPNR